METEDTLKEDVDLVKVEDVVDESTDNQEQIPRMTEPSWHEYIMKQFLEDEIIDGCPTADGLRRVAEIYVGTIIEVLPTVYQCPVNENGNRATVGVIVSFDTPSGVVRFGDAVDCYHGNMSKEFSQFPVATAVTRAEARAIRKALRLRKIIAAEERGGTGEIEFGTSQGNKATLTQINLIKKLVERGKLNLLAILSKGEKPVANLTDLTQEQASKLTATINDYIREPDSVPQEFKNA